MKASRLHGEPRRIREQRGPSPGQVADRIPWQLRAACRGLDPETADGYYPESGQPPAELLELCATCPVRRECVTDAIRRRDPCGWWGGLSPQARRQLDRHGPLPDVMVPGRDVQVCGTESGHNRHRSRGEAPCEACREAVRRESKRRRQEAREARAGREASEAA